VKLAVFGAGAVGCWLGARLAGDGADVTLIGRARVLDPLARGVTAVELDGRSWTATPTLATEASAAADADVILVTVKSAATAGAARELAAVAGRAPIVSLQNGVRNVEVLRAALGERVVAGMVPFNVVWRGPDTIARTTAGTLMFGAAPSLATACRAAGLPFETRTDMQEVLWAKLVLNLNNAINALSGRTLVEQLGARAFRRVYAAAQREALDVLGEAGLVVARLTRLPPVWLARFLLVPDAVFRRLAPRFVAIDRAARSSMADDLARGRATEVDYLQGEIVALAKTLGRDAPVNRTLAQLVHAAEAGGRRDFSGGELLELVTRPL
jgi:2-dehydropantoate 2-reductase